MKPTLTIVYVYFNTPQEIIDSVDSLRKTIGSLSHEILIVDNASYKPIPDSLGKHKNISIIKNTTNNGFGNACNQAAKKAKGEYLLFINPDTIFKKNALRNAYKKLQQDKKIGCLGFRYTNAKGNTIPSVSGMPTWFSSLVSFSLLRHVPFLSKVAINYFYPLKDSSKEQEVNVIGGACMLIPKNVFQKVKGFDSQFFLYFEEADICKRIKNAGYKLWYLPTAVITHLVGRSSTDKHIIQNRFEKSRYLFLKKYYGFFPALIVEAITRFLQPVPLILFIIIFLSAFLLLFKITTYMMFFGDFARDFLVAREMILYQRIPLVGIPSSVVWLHQGPLSIYFIGFALFIGNFAPYAPAIFYACIGILTTWLVYLFSKTAFDRQVGLLAAFLYATSPLIIVGARMPYHTSAIPFFATLFFLFLHLFLYGNRKILFWLFFVLGLLFQLELSNGVVFMITFITFFIYKVRLSKNELIKSVLGLSFGILPFILYDFTHRFVQIGGFILWSINRTRLFLGLTTSNNQTTSQLPQAVSTITEHISRIIFPISPWVALSILTTVIGILCFNHIFGKKLITKAHIITYLWIGIPLIGYMIHTSPGSAYFPLLYPVVCIILSLAIQSKKRLVQYISILFFLVVGVYNSYYTVSNNYFLDTKEKKGSLAHNWNYGMGQALVTQEELVQVIIKDARNRPFSLKAGGSLGMFETNLDNYRYLFLVDKENLVEKSKLSYTLYENKKQIPKNKTIYYTNGFIYIVKNEK